LRPAASAIQRAAKSQRAARIALDQQDGLAVAQQWRETARHALLGIAAGTDGDDIGAVHRDGRVGRHPLDNRKRRLSLLLDIEPTMRANVSKAHVIEVGEPQLGAEPTELRGEIDATAPSADDRDFCIDHHLLQIVRGRV